MAVVACPCLPLPVPACARFRRRWPHLSVRLLLGSPVAVATAADDLIDLTGLRHHHRHLTRRAHGYRQACLERLLLVHRVGTRGEADPRPQPHEYLADLQTQRVSTIPVSPPHGSLLSLHATWPSLCAKCDQSSFERMTSSLLAHAYGSVNPPCQACQIKSTVPTGTLGHLYSWKKLLCACPAT
jgi:hypothetical protein